ncbi:MAG: hypothetical protein HQL46_16070, partial [Gammaproteobacteria bacterium]|nr:hypothetical protein [Gammaproteobacteria bacterium]
KNGIDSNPVLPGETFNLNQPGMAREISLPVDDNHYKSPLVESYRLLQGVLHNPDKDRRTTEGVFHIVEGGLPIPFDKIAVPVNTYEKLLQQALTPPKELMTLPLTSKQKDPVKLWVSLLLRPVVRPSVADVLPEKSMEVRFFAPGSLVSNLDFVESIFGNAGDPYLPEHDAALDIHHWTGTTGCIILAPHLINLTKVELGLPHYDDATERQRKDGMCYKDKSDKYNNGSAFKVVCRDKDGVIVTIIADNYFGYSKKEIKSQISYSANIFGGCEEEHAGGAIAYPRFNLGQIYIPQDKDLSPDRTFKHLTEALKGKIEVYPEGYAKDKKHSDIIYVSEKAEFDMQKLSISWKDSENIKQKLTLLPEHSYVYPSGFSIHMERHPHAPSWRLIGTLGEGTFCHKPSTVSGGGKSEISKSIQDLMISGPIFIGNLEQDLDYVDKIFNYDFSQRFLDPLTIDGRSLLSPYRSLGSTIKLLTPSNADYTEQYNQWLSEIPPNILALVYMIKRFYKQEWGTNWRQHFSVDEVNGHAAHELKYKGRNLQASYLRVGSRSDGTWRLFKLRQDFVAAAKLQTEDDISASTVVPSHYLSGLNPQYSDHSVKLVKNCESRLFQRPDDAIHRGMDKQAEKDLSSKNNFISNFQPLKPSDARDLMNDVINFEEFTKPMRKLVRKAALMDEKSYFVSSAHPRLVNGKPSPNVRYLQKRPDLADPKPQYLAKVCTRLSRGLSREQSVYFPVNAVLQGRRNNPADRKNKIRPLAVYNPIHYQELPELFMDLISSLTGKSPSTTGAGSEGALTKGPFNALSTTADLNTALVTFILCGHAGFSTAAGYIGHKRKIDHDISMLIPEIWCRIPVEERTPEYLIESNCFEKMEDFEHNGEKVHASRLGYRMTEKFVHNYFGKIFDRPMIVIDENMLKPEIQDLEDYIDGIKNIVEAHQKVALNYFADGTIHDACPPLKALLSIMAYGKYEGLSLQSPEFRELFTRNNLLKSDWYQERLKIKQERDEQLWQLNHNYLKDKLNKTPESDTKIRNQLEQQLKEAHKMINNVKDESYFQRLQGTLGADWIHRG